MGELIAKEKTTVVPGQVIAKGMDFLPSHGTYRLKDDVIANRLGILSVEGKVLKTIPINGRYLPRKDDVIIGKVNDILMSGWRMDINSPYSAVLPLKDASFDYIQKGADLTKYFRLEDYAVAKITSVTSQNLVDITVKGPGLRRLRGGRVIKVSPHKVPRIIGKKVSMVSMIKNGTGCKIIVGQNGLVWLEGEPDMEVVAVSALKKIQDESHISGLTERIKIFLEKTLGKKIEEQAPNEDNNDNKGHEYVSKREENNKHPVPSRTHNADKPVAEKLTQKTEEN